MMTQLWMLSRLQTNRGYKKTNRNTDFLLMIFVSYSRIRILKKGIRIRMKRIRILKMPIRFIRNRIQKITRIIRMKRIGKNLSVYTGNNLDTKELIQM